MLVKAEAVVPGHPVATALLVVREYLTNFAKEVRAEPGMIADFVDDVAASVSETVAQNHGVPCRQIPIEAVAHLDRRWQRRVSLVEKI
jgi:hypothetical protein